MQIFADTYLSQVKNGNTVRRSFHRMQRLLALLVIPAVFWGLKLTGITMAGEAFCGMEEHTHSEDCVRQELICELEETPSHTHTKGCLSAVLICDLPEQDGHIHSDACRSRTLVCTLKESEGHSHLSECYTKTWLCNLPEEAGHSHEEACYGYTISCGLEESGEHSHSDSCLTPVLVCGLPVNSGHIHNAECYTETLTCLQEETAGHIHSDDCYVVEEGYCCGQEEQQGHAHSEDCFFVEEGKYICGQEETEGHTHGEQCYRMLEGCPIAEHIHTANCYSDINADLETDEDWEGSLANLIRSSDTVENVLLVARSQLGVTESTRNFQVDEFGIRRGITRYGQWYGNPYGDWSAMFVSFCLDYAGVQDITLNSGPESLRVAWEEAQLYVPAEELVPYAGDLVFLDKDEDGAADAVAIITDLQEDVIFAIEGDLREPVTRIGSVELYPAEEAGEENAVSESLPAEEESSTEQIAADAVAQTLYSLDDPAIMGYGWIPREMGFAVLAPGDCYIWLDGTDGGLGHLGGAPNTMYTVKEGNIIQLPDTWTSPGKYSYKLRGWYDITNARYYKPGEEMVVAGNAVLYADWVASTYDIGQFNAQVANTVSTNSFITTHMFDFNYLFNLHSTQVQQSVSASGHSETWSMVTSGTVAHNGADTFNFIFIDNDSGGRLCMPNNRSSHNVYPGAGIVTPNIYSASLGEQVFATDNCFDPDTGKGILGKTYLGTGDHLFQIMDNPNDEHYGYYYYDSRHNAASYHQGNQRFYVYEYLEATSDAIGSTYSDFLPLNSPYTNTNGKTVGTYNYSGVDGEYQGVPHYRYDSKYNSGNYNSENNVQTDYASGMRSDIKFYLPNDPGTDGNKDLYGNDMQFQFSGDDDLWVLIDGQLVLDIGGIHGAEEGVIDFSTGIVTVQGKQQESLMDLGIGAGDHTLSVLYLERGSSLSNCSIYFNLAPRFSLELKKEDVLTQELLNGTQFTVYEDFNCTEPASLWVNEEAYYADQADGILDQAQSTFTVTNGTAKMWGLGSGNTYYIKETGEPNAKGYGLSDGLIRLTIEREGLATYKVDVIPDAQGNEPSNGFTVHGVKIDEESKTVYIVATNAPDTVVETTTVQVLKEWEDTKDHSNDYVQAYLTVTDPDGTVRRIREVTLSDENDWGYIWTNLPKYNYDQLTEVKYGIEESYESGYYSTVRQITQIEISKTEWAEAASILNGESYILKHSNGYLSTTSASDGKLKWVDEATAQTSALATWKATVSGNKVKLTNGAGQILTFNYSSSSNSRYFYATTANATYQSFTPVDAGSGFRFYATRSNRNYYMASSGINNSGRIPTTTTASNGLILTPIEQITEKDVQQVQDWGYQITNTPLSANNETSMTVKKNWVIPPGYSADLYQEFAVTVRLLANGVSTGRTVTLTLKNGWEGAFLGLPYTDTAGNVIAYTVEEVWSKDRWATSYGEITVSNASAPTYSIEITNTYHAGGPELPSTGTAARLLYILCGGGIMLSSLVYGIILRRKRERRMKQSF